MNHKGLTPAEVEESRQKHGSNALTQIPPEPLWKKILEGFKDPMIMILLAALVIQVILYFMGEADWYEPAGILVAIIIANGVSAVSENKQESKASALKAEEDAKETAKVMRDGILTEIHVSEVVVGDILYLQAGDKLAADGEVVEGELKVDQAALNGETEEAEKHPNEMGDSYDTNDLLNEYYVYRGTVVCGGEAYVKVKVVGDNTLFGKLALEVQEDTRDTPLQVKLAKLAKQISTFGYVGAIAIIIGVLAKKLITGDVPQGFIEWIKTIIEAVTVAVTIIVCAVPEGLPMLTSILLSFQSLRMAKDNVLVRKINGLETAGSLSILFSDKTGTITEGRLSVVEVMTGKLRSFKTIGEMPADYVNAFVIGTGVNNSAAVSAGKVIGGNSTDRALMEFLLSYSEVETLSSRDVVSFSAFDSNKKCSSVVVMENNAEMTYLKGAPERIVERCRKYLDENGNVHDFTESDKKAVMGYIDEQAARSMRILACAKYTDENDIILVSVICIRDNVRKEAVDAIKEVKNAGIQVVMVTGDRKETAVAIAKDAKLLEADTDVAITSQEMAEMSDEELKKILPDLRVVARALPTDKSRLVRVAQELNMVVGMTGDGVNDSPALKKADVGFAMGSGTEVAKEAGDIIILDDNFSSIEKAILYGRTMFKSIRKFLIFQLTVNVAAVATCFIGPLITTETVIMSVIQLLLVNLAMDTLAAIAFGSEPALKEYMKDKPVPREESIVSRKMLIEIIISAIYITIICLGILTIPFIRNMFGDVDTTYLKSAIFATFMMAITFNGFNARTDSVNPFENLGRNRNFILVMGAILIVQFLFVTFGGEVLGVEPLTAGAWLVCAVMAFLVIPVDMIRKAIVKAMAK